MLPVCVANDKVSRWTARQPDETTDAFIARLRQEQQLPEELDPVVADRIAGLLMTP